MDVSLGQIMVGCIALAASFLFGWFRGRHDALADVEYDLTVFHKELVRLRLHAAPKPCEECGHLAPHNEDSRDRMRK